MEHLHSMQSEIVAMVENYPGLEPWRAALDATHIRPLYDSMRAREKELTRLRAENERLRAVLGHASLGFHSSVVLNARGRTATLHGDNSETLTGCLHSTCQLARAALEGKEEALDWELAEQDALAHRRAEKETR